MSVATKYEIRPPTTSDVDYLAGVLRSIDISEILAISGRSAKSALTSGMKMSEYCRVGTVDDVPVCMFGVARKGSFSDVGIVWLLGSDEINKHAVRFIRMNEDELANMTDGFTKVENHCDARNKGTIRWLKWLGFKFDEAKPYGRKKEMFHHFYKEVT